MFGTKKLNVVFVPCKVCGKYPGVCVGDTFVHITCPHEDGRSISIRVDELDDALRTWEMYFGVLPVVDCIPSS
jgi:hypothetical protein